jgi:hypothetical protein
MTSNLKQHGPCGGGSVCRAIRLLVTCVVAMFFLPGFSADSPNSKEYQIKAAFLYNFTKFVEWPAHSLGSTNAPIIIGVLGRDPFNGELGKVVKDRFVNGHAILVTNVTAPGLVNAHVVFVPNGEEEKWRETLEQLRGKAVLTVGESDKFADAGGMILFTREGDKVRFEINQDSTDEAGLKVNSQLLKLATKIRRKPKGL